MGDRIRIVIVDDHPIVRKGLKGVIEEQPDLQVIAEAGDGVEGLSLIEKLRPEVAIVDLEMPKKDGFAVALELRRLNIPVALVFLTFHDDADLLHRAVDLGGLGYLLKESALTDIVNAVRSVAAGRAFVSSSMTPALLRRRENSKAKDESIPNLRQLTPAERRILNLIAEGKATKEIADGLGIHPRTVESHRSAICQKLGLTGTNSLLRFMLEHKGQILS
jgi:DNA-binding NarL/FixJ family response regulator